MANIIQCIMQEKSAYAMRETKPRSACTFLQSDPNLHCLLTESLDTVRRELERRPDQRLQRGAG